MRYEIERFSNDSSPIRQAACSRSSTDRDGLAQHLFNLGLQISAGDSATTVLMIRAKGGFEEALRAERDRLQDERDRLQERIVRLNTENDNLMQQRAGLTERLAGLSHEAVLAQGKLNDAVARYQRP